MSYRGSFFLRGLGVLILVGILAAGGVLLYQTGQAQGYQMGAAAASAAASGEAPGTAPLAPYGPGYWPYYARPPFGFFPFFPFGALCGSILLVLFGLFALRLIFRPRHWFDPGKGPGDWGEHPHEWGFHPWGPPPWMKDRPQAETGQGRAKTAPDQPAGESPA